MGQLLEMGFFDRKLNETLLKKYNNNMQSVVDELLHVTGNDWQQDRHWNSFLSLFQHFWVHYHFGLFIDLKMLIIIHLYFIKYNAVVHCDVMVVCIFRMPLRAHPRISLELFKINAVLVKTFDSFTVCIWTVTLRPGYTRNLINWSAMYLGVSCSYNID